MLCFIAIIILGLILGYPYYLIFDNLYYIPLCLLLGFISSIILFVIYVFIIWIILPWFKPKSMLKKNLLRPIVMFVHYIYRIKVTVIGKENIPTETFVCFPNHKSFFDISIIYQTFNQPMGAAGKKELLNLPFFKRLFKATNSVIIDRESDRESVKNLIKATKLIKSGLNYIICPEGGRKNTNTDLMVDLKAGAYKIATKPEVLIVPVSLIGCKDIKHKGFFKVKKTTIIIHKPIPFQEYKDYNSQDLGLKVGTIVNNGILTLKSNFKTLDQIEIVPFIEGE